MQATHDGDAHPLPCEKTLSMAETLEINNPTILIWPEQADSNIGKYVIIGESREPKKEKKVLDREVVLEKSNDNRKSLNITIKSSGLRGKPKLPWTSRNQPLTLLFKKGQLGQFSKSAKLILMLVDRKKNQQD